MTNLRLSFGAIFVHEWQADTSAHTKLLEFIPITFLQMRKDYYRKIKSEKRLSQKDKKWEKTLTERWKVKKDYHRKIKSEKRLSQTDEKVRKDYHRKLGSSTILSVPIIT